MIKIIASKFNKNVTEGLLSGCLEALNQNQIDEDSIEIIKVPGAFDIPSKVSKILNEDKFNSLSAVITLGCVIKGETDHYDYICSAVSKGIMELCIKYHTPILFGILTCQNSELAIARSSAELKKNKGFEVGLAAIDLIS